MNPVLTLTRNNLALTQRCVASIQKQDIVSLAEIVDNGSTDETVSWVTVNALLLDASPFNCGVSAGWNRGLSELFSFPRISHVLVVGNDTVLPPWFYRTLLSINVPFVTGVAVDNMDQALQSPYTEPLTPNPDFSAFLIRREAWDKIGPFDERFKHYCGDCDMHIRAHRLGMSLWKAPVPFYHERSSTLRLADEQDRIAIHTQANKDREVFLSLYGCLPGDKAYEALFL